MRPRWAAGSTTSAALVEHVNRGWFSGSLTADLLRNGKNSHGPLVILTVGRPMRAGPRAHRESASGQKRTPLTEYRKNKATCHASPPAPPCTSPHWALSPAATARQWLASSVDGVLRAYPKSSAARKVIQAQAKCTNTREFSTFFSHRMSNRRKRFIQACVRSTTQRRARSPGISRFACASSPRRRL
jgi:hypothetical protein